MHWTVPTCKVPNSLQNSGCVWYSVSNTCTALRPKTLVRPIKDHYYPSWNWAISHLNKLFLHFFLVSSILVMHVNTLMGICCGPYNILPFMHHEQCDYFKAYIIIDKLISLYMYHEPCIYLWEQSEKHLAPCLVIVNKHKTTSLDCWHFFLLLSFNWLSL